MSAIFAVLICSHPCVFSTRLTSLMFLHIRVTINSRLLLVWRQFYTLQKRQDSWTEIASIFRVTMLELSDIKLNWTCSVCSVFLALLFIISYFYPFRKRACFFKDSNKVGKGLWNKQIGFGPGVRYKNASQSHSSQPQRSIHSFKFFAQISCMYLKVYVNEIKVKTEE